VPAGALGVREPAAVNAREGFAAGAAKTPSVQTSLVTLCGRATDLVGRNPKNVDVSAGVIVPLLSGEAGGLCTEGLPSTLDPTRSRLSGIGNPSRNDDQNQHGPRR